MKFIVRKRSSIIDRLSFMLGYPKIIKTGTHKIITIIVVKNRLVWFYNEVICPKIPDGMVNSVGPDQTAPFGAV